MPNWDFPRRILDAPDSHLVPMIRTGRLHLGFAKGAKGAAAIHWNQSCFDSGVSTGRSRVQRGRADDSV